MSGFEDREQSFEHKYALNEKLDFAVEARCCKLFGLWAARKLGLEGDSALAYAMEVVDANLDEAGFADVIRKVQGDLKHKGQDYSDHLMHLELEKALSMARDQIMSEKS